MVVGDHDGFPCHELYINRQQIYTYDPVARGNDPSNLFPPTDREISTGWISIPQLTLARAQAQAYDVRTRARTLAAEDWSINWDDVFPVGQPTSQSCWATAAAMIDGWRRRQSVSIDAIAQFDNLSTQNGLPPASAARFAEAIGFTVHPNACYTPAKVSATSSKPMARSGSRPRCRGCTRSWSPACTAKTGSTTSASPTRGTAWSARRGHPAPMPLRIPPAASTS